MIMTYGTITQNVQYERKVRICVDFHPNVRIFLSSIADILHFQPDSTVDTAFT